MIVLQRHLWLNLSDLKDADHKVLLNAPVTPSVLFGDDVESIIESFAEAQKRTKAMSHVMPRRAFQQQMTRSRCSLAPDSSQRRDNPRPVAAVVTATAPRQEPDLRVPVGSAMASWRAHDVTLDRRRLLSCRPDGLKTRRRARERPSSQAPKVHMFKCLCVGCSVQ